MEIGVRLLGLIGTIVIAGWVAYAISTPRNFNNAMANPEAALEGTEIGSQLAEAKADAYAEQCAQFQERSQEAWDRAVENDTIDRDSSEIDRLNRQVDRFCNA